MGGSFSAREIFSSEYSYASIQPLFITVEILSDYSLLFIYDYISHQSKVIYIYQCAFNFA